MKRTKEYRRIKYNLLTNGFILILGISLLILSIQYIQTNYNVNNNHENHNRNNMRHLLQTNSSSPTTSPTLAPSTRAPTPSPTKTYEIEDADYPPDLFTKVR